jgi:hypothetical protein
LEVTPVTGVRRGEKSLSLVPTPSALVEEEEEVTRGEKGTEGGWCCSPFLVTVERLARGDKTPMWVSATIEEGRVPPVVVVVIEKMLLPLLFSEPVSKRPVVVVGERGKHGVVVVAGELKRGD